MLSRDDASTALALARPRTPALIEPTLDSGVTVQALGRQVLRLLPTPLAEGSGGALATKHIYVIGDEQHPISLISRRLKDLGAVVFELLMPASGCADD